MANNPPPGDKAPWDIASASIVSGSMYGAKAGEEAFPGMLLDSLDIEMNERPKFNADGSAVMDTDEPGDLPVKVTYRFIRDKTPKLESR